MKTADKTTFRNAEDIFNETLSTMMKEMNIDSEHYTKKEIHSFINVTTAQFGNTWDDYVLWFLYGDDKLAKFKNMMRICFKHGKRKFIF